MNRKARAPIEWDRVRERMARASAALEEALQASPARARAVLEERARHLARPPAPSPEPAVDVVVFRVEQARYAIAASDVRQVGRLGPWARVPGAPHPIVGVTTVQAAMLPLADLRLALGIGGEVEAPAPWLVVIGPEVAPLALLADELLELRTQPLRELTPVPFGPEKPGDGAVSAVTPDGVLILSVARLAPDPRIEETP